MIYVFLFLLGAAVGSFLNVLIDRLPRKEGFLFGRSYCENCRTPLPWFDLIPIFSFFWLRGRCRFCKTRIPLRLLVVEILTGVGFVLLFWLGKDYHGLYYWLLITVYCLLFSSFIVLFFTDLEYGILPDRVVAPAMAATLVWRITPLVLNTRYWILPALGLALFFLFLIAITRGRGMGFGDVKLGFLVGLVLGWPGTLVAAFLAFLLGGLVSAILLVVGRKHFGETVPFGPFLIIGTGIAVVFGSQIWSWYLSLL